MEKDIKHLRILGTINYVIAGIMSLIFVLPLIYFNLSFILIYMSSISLGMSWYLHGSPNLEVLNSGKGPGFLIIVFPLIFGFIFGLTMLASTIATYYLGKSLRAQKNYIFCLVMSALSATSFPFGTILGAFSLVVLLRDSVKTLFAENAIKKI